MTINQLKYVITLARCASMNEAAKKLFISQPSLSASVKELEKELGIQIFKRTNRGIALTPDGKEFLGYASQIIEQYDLVENKYVNKDNNKKKFSVSMQHYSFAVNAFINTVNKFGMNEYEFACRETQTYDVVDDVRTGVSEIGILFINDFNRNVLEKLFSEYNLEFHPLLNCGIYAYLWKKHPLAKKTMVTLDDLMEYPFLFFDQGEHNSFYFSEEVLSTYDFKRKIKANDRATLLNLMVGLNGYTLCSGIISEDLNGSNYMAIKLDSEEIMTIGYIKRKNSVISEVGKQYIQDISKYKNSGMK